MSDTHISKSAPVQVINTFTVKPGKMDEFIAVQEAARSRFAAVAPGLRASRMHRALDDTTAVLIGYFDTKEDNERLQQTALFAEHRERLRALVDKASPALYQVAYEAGDL